MYLSLLVSDVVRLGPVVRLFSKRVVKSDMLPSGVGMVSSRALRVCNCGTQLE
jgi:hypothetical protein